MDIPTILLTLFVTVISALYMGALLAVKLPEFDSKFDRKPFNCRPCLTFHLVWLATTLLSAVAASPALFVAGIAVAFVVFAIVKYIDNQKIEK